MKKAKNMAKQTLFGLGCLFTFIIFLSFTSIPFHMYYSLGAHDNKLTENPKNIILLGAGGMPSAENFMRIHTLVETGLRYPNSKIILSLPGDTTDSNSSICLMRKEVISQGIKKERILLESIGGNTRSQSFEAGKIVSKTDPCLIVTSTYHMYRSIQTFIKEGFTNIGVQNATEIPLEGNLNYNDSELGSSQILDVSENTYIRYQFWQHLKYLVIVFREYTAISYYQLKGWI